MITGFVEQRPLGKNTCFRGILRTLSNIYDGALRKEFDGFYPSADLVKFTKESLNGKLHFLLSALTVPT